MLCLAAAGLIVSLPLTDFTLAWEHTVERIEWQEDYRLTPRGLELTEARIQGNGAGMEPGEGAVLQDGWWRWRPDRPPFPELVLASSGVGEWRICWVGEGCRELDSLIGGAGPITLAGCR
jgi:hypothetical protein